MQWVKMMGLLTSTAFMFGCAQSMERADTPAVFRSCLHPDQSKQFTYRKGRPMQMEKKVMLQRMANERPMNGRASQSDRYAKEPGKGPLYDELAELMATKKFCRDGYFELDSNFEPGYEYIVGECNDSASAEDEKKLTRCGPEDTL